MIHQTDWVIPIDEAGIQVRDLMTSKRLKSVTGRSWIQQFHARAVASHNATAEELAVRTRQAELSLHDLIATLKERRQGFPCMRGYYRIVEVCEP